MQNFVSTPSTSTSTVIPDTVMDLSDLDFTTSLASPSHSAHISDFQPRIDYAFKQIKLLEEGGKRASEITNALIYMIAKDNMPLKTVDNEGFRNFMKTVVPLYSVPGRKSVTKKIEENYEYLSSCIKERLKTIDNFSITTDIWTDILNTVSYLGVTAHYIHDNEMKSTVIGLTELIKRHTSDNISSAIKIILQDWNINENKIIVFVTDSGANMKKAVKDTVGAIKHISCFAHAINLVAQDTMDFPEATDLCKKIVTFFK